MTYSRSGDRITVEFSFDEFRGLLQVLDMAHALSPEDSPLRADLAVTLSRLYAATTEDLALYALLPLDPAAE